MQHIFSSNLTNYRDIRHPVKSNDHEIPESKNAVPQTLFFSFLGTTLPMRRVSQAKGKRFILGMFTRAIAYIATFPGYLWPQMLVLRCELQTRVVTSYFWGQLQKPWLAICLGARQATVQSPQRLWALGPWTNILNLLGMWDLAWKHNTFSPGNVFPLLAHTPSRISCLNDGLPQMKTAI